MKRPTDRPSDRGLGILTRCRASRTSARVSAVTRMYVKSKCTIPANHFEYFIMGAKYHYLPPVRHPPPPYCRATPPSPVIYRRTPPSRVPTSLVNSLSVTPCIANITITDRQTNASTNEERRDADGNAEHAGEGKREASVR